MRYERLVAWRWRCPVLLAGGVLLCLGLSMDTGKAAQGVAPGFQRLLDADMLGEEEQAKVRQALRISYVDADGSLELREQMDFLLTPALLVQEAVSDGVVMTYPEE